MPRLGEQLRRVTPAGLVTFVVVLAAAGFTLSQMQPGLLVTNTTPAGGDMGAHVWGPAYLRDHLLPSGRLSGWTPDWYAGFPALTFYFPLPALAIVLLDVVLPYGVAFKLVSVSGVVTLPVAAWAFGKLSGLRFPGPPFLALATLPFLFDRTFSIYGGNIPSTLAGEFAFSISLSVGLVFLGVFARGLEDGRHRALAAVLLAVTGLSHVIPAFFVLAGAVLILLTRLDRQRLRWAVPVFAVGGLLAAFWVVPFLMRLPYTNDMGWEKLTAYQKQLLPFTSPCDSAGCKADQFSSLVTNGFKYAAGLAVVGVLLALGLRKRTGLVLFGLAALSAAAFRYVPQGRLWNARLLPFWFLSVYLLAGFAAAQAADIFARAASAARGTFRRRDADEPGWISLLAPGLGLILVLLLVAPPVAHGKPSFLPKTTDVSYIPDWARWNYRGYERKDSYPEYRTVVSTMARVGREEGCGRAMWEYEKELDRYGTPMALMLLPYWTDGCIGSMEGLFFESSATTPYHFLNQSELSRAPSCAQRDLEYANCSGQNTPKVADGVEHLKLMGVRYYMAISDEAKGQARRNPDLRLLTTTPAFNVNYSDSGSSQVKARSWDIFEVKGSELVEPLRFQPAVMTNVSKGGKPWLLAAQAWYLDAGRWGVPLAASGPASWPRVRVGSDGGGPLAPGVVGTPVNPRADVGLPDPPRRPVEPVVVSGIKTSDDRISFDVDRVGSPVLVKASYFPNWKAAGADGPWRVTPNLMVVIPTSRHVELRYGFTPVDVGAWVLTGLGVVGVVVLGRAGPVLFRRPSDPADEVSMVISEAPVGWEDSPQAVAAREP